MYNPVVHYIELIVMSFVVFGAIKVFFFLKKEVTKCIAFFALLASYLSFLVILHQFFYVMDTRPNHNIGENHESLCSIQLIFMLYYKKNS